MNTAVTENIVVSEAIAAQVLGRAAHTLRNDRHLKKGPPYIKIGRSVRYRISDLHRYIEKHRIDPEATA